MKTISSDILKTTILWEHYCVIRYGINKPFTKDVSYVLN